MAVPNKGKKRFKPWLLVIGLKRIMFQKLYISC